MIQLDEGKEKYVFISYSHADTNVVLKYLDKLQNKNIRLWYDLGITPGSEWPETIAEHILGCTIFIAFISRNYLKSNNCKKELTYVLDKKRPIIVVFLEEVNLSPGMAMQLSIYQNIMPKKDSTIDSIVDSMLMNSDVQACLEEKYEEEIPTQPSSFNWKISVIAGVVAALIGGAFLFGSGSSSSEINTLNDSNPYTENSKENIEDFAQQENAEGNEEQENVEDYEEDTENNENQEKDLHYKVGDIISFGRNEKQNLDYQWTVVDENLSYYTLVANQLYYFSQVDEEANYWKDTYLRKYINNILVDELFNQDEKAMLIPFIYSGSVYEATEDYKPSLSRKEDLVSILSINEIQRYCKNLTQKRCVSAETHKYESYWLRDQTKKKLYCYVDEFGEIKKFQGDDPANVRGLRFIIRILKN